MTTHIRECAEEGQPPLGGLLWCPRKGPTPAPSAPAHVRGMDVLFGSRKRPSFLGPAPTFRPWAQLLPGGQLSTKPREPVSNSNKHSNLVRLASLLGNTGLGKLTAFWETHRGFSVLGCHTKHHKLGDLLGLKGGPLESTSHGGGPEAYGRGGAGFGGADVDPVSLGLEAWCGLK